MTARTIKIFPVNVAMIKAIMKISFRTSVNASGVGEGKGTLELGHIDQAIHEYQLQSICVWRVKSWITMIRVLNE